MSRLQELTLNGVIEDSDSVVFCEDSDTTTMEASKHSNEEDSTDLFDYQVEQSATKTSKRQIIPFDTPLTDADGDSLEEPDHVVYCSPTNNGSVKKRKHFELTVEKTYAKTDPPKKKKLMLDDYETDDHESVIKKNQLFGDISFIFSGVKMLPPYEDEFYNFIEELVLMNGGKVVDKLTLPLAKNRKIISSQFADAPNVILISNQPQRTEKYLVAVATGTLTLHYNWIKHCCDQKLLLPYRPYQLPAGLCILSERPMFINDSRVSVFENWDIYLDGAKEFQPQWHTVIAAAGGNPKTLPNEIYYMEVDEENFAIDNNQHNHSNRVLVSLSSISRKLQMAVFTMGITTVSIEWLIQSLIVQCAQPFDGHMKYMPEAEAEEEE